MCYWGKDQSKDRNLDSTSYRRAGWRRSVLPGIAESSLREEKPHARTPAAGKKIPIQFRLCRRAPGQEKLRDTPALPACACAAAKLCSRWLAALSSALTLHAR